MASSFEDPKPSTSDAPDEDSSSELQPEEEEPFVHPKCCCESCTHWVNSVDWSTEHNYTLSKNKKNVMEHRRIQPFIRSDKFPGKPHKVQSYQCQDLSRLEKLKLPRILVHGFRNNIPQPVNSVTDTYFDEKIHEGLRALKYTHSLPIQSFVWPAIFRQLNVFMVGPPKCGKTMAYLPAMCSFALMKNERYSELAKHKGPLIIIICPSSQQCEEIFDLIGKLYEGIHFKPKAFILTYPLSYINNVDILITIPSAIFEAVRLRILTFKRLCHLVFEDTSTLCRNDPEGIRNIIEIVNEMLEHRVSDKKVQLIVSSLQWSSDIEHLLRKAYSTPLVCISNHLEAALYGNTNFEVKFVKSELKLKHLQGIVQHKYKTFKTLVICNKSEIHDVQTWLIECGIKTLCLTNNSGKDEIEDTESLWMSQSSGNCEVLLCTDFVFDKFLIVDNAMWLVHYSLPNSWREFVRRFSAISSNMYSPLEEEDVGPVCKSVILMDETCEKQKSKILHLIKRLCNNMSETHYKLFTEIIDNLYAEQENFKIENKVELCETLKLFGRCPNPYCKSRHFLQAELDTNNDLPKNGKITFKILHVHDVTKYSVQLIRHTDLDGHINEINNDDLTESLIFDKDDPIQKVEDAEIKPGKFFAHCDYDYNSGTKHFTLCLVVKVEDETFVEVKLMNTFQILQTMKTKLFHLPSNLKIVEIYLCNLIPPFRDERFSSRSFNVTRSALQSVEYRKKILTGDIYLQLHNTLWLHNVVERTKSLGDELITFNFSKYLKERKVVEADPIQLNLLYRLCKKCEIALPIYFKQQPKKIKKEQAVKAQWAFLNDEEVNEVYISSGITPGEFFVRLTKFQSLLDNLMKEIQVVASNPILSYCTKVDVGKYYLVKDPEGIEYSRALVLNTKDNQALVYFVDYGDEAVVEISQMKVLPSKFITKLPFQAIQCTLHGISPNLDEWSDHSTDVLYRYILEPDSDIFRLIFAKVYNKESNSDLRTNMKYSVVLKDGFEVRSGSINQLLIDCGFAKLVGDEIEDFEIPEPKIKEEEDSDDDIDEQIDTDDIDLDNFDLEIFDPQEFLKCLIGANDGQLKELLVKPAIDDRNTNDKGEDRNTSNKGEDLSEYNQPSGHLVPEVYWSQTDDIVKLKIKLIDVEKCNVNVMRKTIFSFSTNLEGRKYSFKCTLHKTAELRKYSIKGREVQVILNKLEAIEWPQLTKTSRRLRNVHYEIPKKDLEDEKPKKFLQFDVPDPSSDDDDDDEDNLVFYDVSDVDSDYDYELWSDSEGYDS